jgi:hypothetical protein
MHVKINFGKFMYLLHEQFPYQRHHVQGYNKMAT